MDFIERKYRAEVQRSRLFGFCRRFYKKYKRVEYSTLKGVYSATIAKNCFPSFKNPKVSIYLDADILERHPLTVSWHEVRYAKRDWEKAFRHIFMYGFSEWWCHQNSRQEKWDERVFPRDDGYELLQEIIQKQGENDIVHCEQSQKDNEFIIGSKGSGKVRSFIKPIEHPDTKTTEPDMELENKTLTPLPDEETAIDLVVRKVFFAYEDDRLSYIHHYSGPDGVKELTTLICQREKLDSEIIELVYNQVMSILDEIALKGDNTRNRYRALYYTDIHNRLRDRGYRNY